MNEDAVKVSVLSSGAILLEGQDATLAELELAFQAAKERKAPVLYYREAASANPPPEARNVLQMIAANRLAVSLSSRPDFSDWVDQHGGSHPRPLEPAADSEAFAKVRHAAKARQIVIVRRDRQYLLLPVPPAGSMQPAAVKSVESMISPGTQRNVAVIADTGFACSPKPPGVAEAGRAIPFFGLLLGFSYIGHAVWIFEGEASVLEAGCRDADVLLVDSGVIARLPKDWGKIASAAMRNSNIILLDRATQKFLSLTGKIEFPHCSAV